MEQKILEGDDDGQNLLRHDSLGLCLHFSSRTCNHYFSEFFVLVSVRVVFALCTNFSILLSYAYELDDKSLELMSLLISSVGLLSGKGLHFRSRYDITELNLL